MKIAIVGGSASGIYLALLLLSKYPRLHVVLFDKEEKFGKKIAATGNGRCNILHHCPSPLRYDHPKIFSGALERYPFPFLVDALASFGVPLKREGDLYYPRSQSAPGLTRFFLQSLRDLGADVRLGTKVLDYKIVGQSIELRLAEGTETFDEIVFATGGKSGKNLGSDGSLFPIFARHGYALTPLFPGLCPIKTMEKHPDLQGVRVDGSLRIVCDGQTFEEEGQVLFKRDGLSGIVTFNAESFLLKTKAPKGSEIHLDLFPEWNEKELAARLRADGVRPYFLETYLPSAVAKRFASENRNGPDALARKLKDWVFHFDCPYGFEDSQVTIGGISWKGMDERTLASTSESHVHFVGECLDMAGDCGGYNLTWCLLSALLVAEDFDEILRG